MDPRSLDQTWTVRGRTLDLKRPAVMGILNTTPDSFSDGGEFLSPADALHRVGEMVAEGADIIDVGGESTRPGAEPVPDEIELSRVRPVLETAVEAFPGVLFSIDTTKMSVAREALDAGFHFINDVSGLRREPALAELAAETGAGYILMHSRGNPRTMQKNPVYSDLIGEVKQFFHHGCERLQDAGVGTVLLDPGIGFGKTLEHNLRLVAELDKFREFGYPLLVGASRKSVVGRLLNDRPSGGRLAGTLALHYHCLINGARLLRVHDVREARDTVAIFHAVTSVHL